MTQTIAKPTQLTTFACATFYSFYSFVPMKSVTISSNEANQRFDRFVRKYFKEYSDIGLSDIFRRIRHRDIRINGKKTKENYRLHTGDIVSFHFSGLDDRFKIAPTRDAKAELITLDDITPLIIYEDQDRIVWNKPPHMVVHAGNDHLDDLSLQDYLRIYTSRIKEGDRGSKRAIEDPLSTSINLPQPSSTFQPSLCYRLDRDTSGVLVSAITYPALQHLNEQIRERKVHKVYQAIVAGITPEDRTADEPLFKGFNKTSGRGQSFVNREK
ncbi:MAG: hypothetical protein H6766_01820 [Candidatus Peribacteria bacterium]|nr:MAG: hypothetical protein H6766_01820 [Candidatus Peribacteria bacterium]